MLIVTTPQEVALGDVRRALTLFRERKIPILGLVENMSHLVCEHCGARNAAFPASSLSQNGDPGVSNETLARIPLTPELCAAGDGGVPLVLQDRESEAKTALLSLADRIAAAPLEGDLGRRSRRSIGGPTPLAPRVARLAGPEWGLRAETPTVDYNRGRHPPSI